MTPASLDSAFMCFTFPADKLNCISFSTTALSLLIMTRNATEIRLRAAHIPHDLRFQLLRTFELLFVAQPTQKLDPDLPRRIAFEAREQKRFDGQVGPAERGAVADIGDRLPGIPGAQVMRSRNVD